MRSDQSHDFTKVMEKEIGYDVAKCHSVCPPQSYSCQNASPFPCLDVGCLIADINTLVCCNGEIR